MSPLYTGIDQSYSGFAIAFYRSSGGDHEVIRRVFPADKYGTGVDRLIEIEDWVYDEVSLRHRGFTIKHVCMEGYSFESKFGREQSGELGFAVRRALWYALNDDIRYPTIVPPTLLKKYTLGKVGKKEDMKLGAYKKWGVEFKTNDEVDAYALARFAHALDTGGEFGTYAYERECIEGITPHTAMPKAA